MSYVLIIGAKSDIAKAVSRKYASEGYNLYLAARNSTELNNFANDIHIRYRRDVTCVELDILDYESHESFYKSLEEKPLGVIITVGYLGNHKKTQNDYFEARKVIDTNFTGIVSLLNIIANDFEERQDSFIIGVCSVAGDRGRKSNYTYGSAKAALAVYLSGLRNRLFRSNVHVLTVKPGYVDTQMTKDMDLPKRLTAQPEDVANDIFKAQQKKKDVIYTNWKWKWIMLIIKVIPERIFKRMNL